MHWVNVMFIGLVSESDEGEDVEGGNSNEIEDHHREEYLKAQQEKLAVERERIMNDQTIVSEEKTRLLDELKV